MTKENQQTYLDFEFFTNHNELYEYQTKILQSFKNHQQVIVKLPRQSGKTSVATTYLMWRAANQPNQTILMLAPKQLFADGIVRFIKNSHKHILDDHIKCDLKSSSQSMIEFKNGSKIISEAMTSESGRGLDISILYIDEFDYINQTIAKQFWETITPNLFLMNSQVILTSTPRNNSGLFTEIWNDSQLGINGFHSITAKWDEHPDRNEQWKQSMINTIGKNAWDCEYELV